MHNYRVTVINNQPASNCNHTRERNEIFQRDASLEILDIQLY